MKEARSLNDCGKGHMPTTWWDVRWITGVLGLFDAVSRPGWHIPLLHVGELTHCSLRSKQPCYMAPSKMALYAWLNDTPAAYFAFTPSNISYISSAELEAGSKSWTHSLLSAYLCCSAMVASATCQTSQARQDRCPCWQFHDYGKMALWWVSASETNAKHSYLAPSFLSGHSINIIWFLSK